jgi:hypothetical protein
MTYRVVNLLESSNIVIGILSEFHNRSDLNFYNLQITLLQALKNKGKPIILVRLNRHLLLIN